MKILKIFFGKAITAFANRTAIVLQESDKSIISKLREIFRNSTFSISTHILNLGINLVIAILLARCLGPKALGQYALATSIAGIVFGIINFGFQGIITREVAKNKENARKYIGNALGIRLLISLPIGVMFSSAIGLGLGFCGETLTLIFLASVFVGFSGIATLFYALFQAVKRFEAQFSLNLFYKIVSLLGCFFLLEQGGGLIYIFMLFAGLQAVTAILAAFKTSRSICPVRVNIELGFWRDFIKESFPLSLAGTAEFINLKSDAVILGTFKGEVDTGIYNGAYNLYLGAIAPIYAFIVAFYPTFSKTYATSQKQASRLFRSTFILTAIGSFILAFVFILFSKDIVALIYGQKFAASAIPLMILAAGLPFIILNRLNNYTLIAMGLQKWIFYIISYGAIFNVVTNLLLIPKYSYIGASITTIITEGLIFFAGIWMIRVRLKKDREGLDVV